MLMACVVLSRNCEESFSTFSSPDSDPDLDRLRGGPSHGHITYCVKSIGARVFELRARTEIGPTIHI